MRDNMPNTPCHLSEAGTDCCETTFSSLGQWVGNHHNYTLLDMIRNLSHQVRMEQLRADPKGPKFAKPHPKGESIWQKQQEDGYLKVDLTKYPTEGEELVAWQEGIVKAREMAALVGMCPENTVSNKLPPYHDNDK
ncbi:uncharacterized protein [Clytia hemisphaerica]|uniref:uncharacterized protein n=1 Tax=Clytia hemisphaerica TaxID=252671 RepID=UPI0034D58E65